MPIPKKLSGDTYKISVNGQDKHMKIHYDIPEVIKFTDNEPLVNEPLGGELIIEAERNLLEDLWFEMPASQCILYLDDSRHVNFLFKDTMNFDPTRDTVLYLTIELNGPIER